MVGSAAGQIYYVDADAPGSTHETSWEQAFIYLQDALWVAQDGDEIRVAQGVYRPAGPGDVELAVSGKLNNGTLFEATAAIKIVGKR